MSFVNLVRTLSIAALCLTFAAPSAAAASPQPIGQRPAGLGVLQGIVRDNGGNPIADATVAIFRVGTSRLLKQVRSAADGSFIAKIFPGTYTVLAVAEGFNPVTLSQVEISAANASTFGFKLERAGSGNTLPERRLDRNNPKWVIRSAQTSRSIYQNNDSTDSAAANAETAMNAETVSGEGAEESKRPGQTAVETYFASSKSGSYTGVNVATLIPISEAAEIVFAAQSGTAGAPQRLESQLKFAPSQDHQVRLGGSIGKLGVFSSGGREKTLGQISLQATDEWRVRDGVILVLGVDYARFIGGGSDFSLSPRLGFQFDLNSKTRFRSGYSTQTESRTWSRAIELEDAQVQFREPVSADDLAVVAAAPKLNKSSRLEFGIERVLDNRSSIEANFFLDTTFARGIAFSAMPLDAGGAFASFVGNQTGESQGLRLVYSRRLTGKISAAGGYSFGRGQKLSRRGVSNPADLFQSSFFNTLFGQIEADFDSGTSVKTIFRLSPAATVFAVDPFQGRLAIYDPGLSVLVTQSLPTLGLPFRAEAVVDARNLFDFQTGVATYEGSLKLNSQRRALRGGILVRF